MYLGQDSVTRRAWDYDQNDLKRYVARLDPTGSEGELMERKGERFGEALYAAIDSFPGEHEKIVIERERGMKTAENRGEAAQEALVSLGRDAEEEFYRSAVQAVEDRSEKQLNRRSA